jgi:3-deoxy-7-phosphoheptulonate synthase
MIDCSHGNSLKDPEPQPLVVKNCVHQILQGNRSIVGLMLESHLFGGRQDMPEQKSELRYGVSVTDACLEWEKTEATVLEAAFALRGKLEGR